MARKIAMAVAILAVGVGGFALPVNGYFQMHGFFKPGDKYHEWFQSSVPLADTRTRDASPDAREPRARVGTSIKYPYPDKAFIMTGELWLKSVKSVEFGDPDWYDVEVVRQSAETQEYAPAMDMLGWMYENGRGLNQDFLKAFTWYERAKLAGRTELRGSSTRIFQRLTPRDRFLANLQLAEDIQRIRPKAATRYPGFERVKLHVLEQQRDPDYYRRKLNRTRKKKPAG